MQGIRQLHSELCTPPITGLYQTPSHRSITVKPSKISKYILTKAEAKEKYRNHRRHSAISPQTRAANLHRARNHRMNLQ